MSLLAKFIVALFVVFLHNIGPIGIRAVNKHRYVLGWSRMDAVALVLSIVVLAAGILGIDLLVSWSNSAFLRQAFNHLFLVGLVSGWIAAFSRSLWGRPNILHFLWITAAAVIGYSFAHYDTPLVHYAAWSCLILSPIVLLVVIPIFGWQTWSAKPSPMPKPTAAASQGTPVYFFIFDEWSFARSTVEGEFRPQLKNLCKLSDQSIVFRHALSPFNATWLSLPAILFQTDKAFALHQDGPKFQDRDGTVSASQMDNLFRLSRRYNYTSYHLGWYHAYHQLLGDQVDYCHVFQSIVDLVAEEVEQQNFNPVSHEKPMETGLLGKIFYSILGIFPYLTDPISSIIWHRLDISIMCRQWYLMAERYRKEMLQVLMESPRRTFAFFHTPWPHPPFVFATDGSYTGPKKDSWNAKDYQSHIQFVDRVVGEIVDALKNAGKFDDALLILTSDHGWRCEREQSIRSQPNWDRSVPLLIKLPGQQAGKVIEQEICNTQLAPLLEAVFAGDNVNEALSQIIEQTEGIRSMCPTSTAN